MGATSPRLIDLPLVSTAPAIRKLLRPLASEPGPYLQITVRVGDDPQRPPAELLHPLLFDVAFDRGEHLGPGRGIPETVEELAAELHVLPVTGSQMVPFLVHTCTRNLAFEGTPVGPWEPQAAERVMELLVQLMGPQTRWLSNVGYPDWAWEYGDFSGGQAWSPVTGHTFDRAVIGVGGEATVTLLTVADS